jgi:hypothetical protein
MVKHNEHLVLKPNPESVGLVSVDVVPIEPLYAYESNRFAQAQGACTVDLRLDDNGVASHFVENESTIWSNWLNTARPHCGPQIRIACQRLAGLHCTRLHCARTLGSPASPESVSRASTLSSRVGVRRT